LCKVALGVYQSVRVVVQGGTGCLSECESCCARWHWVFIYVFFLLVT
jgi:hypothetical protein